MNTKTEELTIKYPSGFEYAVHMTEEKMECGNH